MPAMPLEDGRELFYRDDDNTPPWSQPEVAMLLHGNAESGLAWYGWMGAMAAQFRVIRPDMRGFGRSTAMPRDFGWSLDGVVDDFIALLDHLGIARVHLVAAKIAGPIALRLAARHPGRVRTLVLLGTLVSGASTLGSRHAEWLRLISEQGVGAWAGQTMVGRLGSAASPAMLAGWTELMGATQVTTQLGFIHAVAAFDVRGDLAGIRCPALVVTTDASGLDSVETTREWQLQIPGSSLLVLPGDSYHVAATHAAECAAATLNFIDRNTKGAQA